MTTKATGLMFCHVICFILYRSFYVVVFSLSKIIMLQCLSYQDYIWHYWKLTYRRYVQQTKRLDRPRTVRIMFASMKTTNIRGCFRTYYLFMMFVTENTNYLVQAVANRSNLELSTVEIRTDRCVSWLTKLKIPLKFYRTIIIHPITKKYFLIAF